MVISLYPRNGGTYMEKRNQKGRWDTFHWNKKRNQVILQICIGDALKKLAVKDGSKSDLKILSENGRHVHNIADGLGDISSGY